MSEDDKEIDVVIDHHIHLYGAITPMELVVRSCTRSVNPQPRWKRGWKEFLDRYDGKGESEGARRRTTSYSDRVMSITLHKLARFLMDETYPLKFLQEKKSRTDPFEWCVGDLPDQNNYDDSPKLDIRHLCKDDVRWEESLQAIVWLLQTNSLMAGSICDFYPGAAVDCRSELVLPLIQTVSSGPLRECRKAYHSPQVRDAETVGILHHAHRRLIRSAICCPRQFSR
jgi:hypothetical protein